MYDKLLILDTFDNIEQSLNDILEWTITIRSADDFFNIRLWNDFIKCSLHETFYCW